MLFLRRILMPGLYYPRLHEAALTFTYCLVFWSIQASFIANILYIIYTHYLINAMVTAYGDKEIDIFHNIGISSYLDRDLILILTIAFVALNYLMLSILLFSPAPCLAVLGIYLLLQLKNAAKEYFNINYIKFTKTSYFCIGLGILMLNPLFENGILGSVYRCLYMWVIYAVHGALLLININIPAIQIFNSITYIAATYTFLVINIGVLRGNLLWQFIGYAAFVQLVGNQNPINTIYHSALQQISF